MSDPKAYRTGEFYKEAFCVSKCPSYKTLNASMQLKTFKQLNITCNETKSLKKLNKNCLSLKALDTSPRFGRFCIINSRYLNQISTSLSKNFLSLYKKFENTQFIKNLVTDIELSMEIILMSFAVSVFLSYIYMHLMRCFAEIITWMLFLSCILLMFGLGGFLIQWAHKIERDVQKTKDQVEEDMFGNAYLSSENQFKLALYVGYLFIGAGSFVLCVLCCLCQKIKLINAILEVSEKIQNLRKELNFWIN